MKRACADFYRSPCAREPVTLDATDSTGDDVLAGRLTSPIDGTFEILDGIPDLTWPKSLPQADARAKTFYENRVEAYEENLYLTFLIHNEDEQRIRNQMIDALNLKPDACVLEIACGTGRDSTLIASRLESEGIYYLQDISPGMVRYCRDKLGQVAPQVEFSVGNACYLPFPDDTFDAVYSFGALGEFSDIQRSLAEMARVTKVGGRIGVGDESMPPWLRETDFARMLTTTNPQFNASLPLREIPVCAREVRLRWLIGGVFYFIDFTVGNGEPTAKFDLEIPGPRGGTLRTRYEGQLEGVTKEAKALAQQAVAKRGISMHRWLDEVVRAAAKQDLD